MGRKLTDEEKKALTFTVHVLPNTHWDREWRFPFQETRLHLLGLMERLVEMLERDPEYRAFNFDSQTIFLDDYLELKPENRDRIARLVAAGRLIVGPWYTLPEMNVIGGESIVRNLLVGKAVADAFGYRSPVGYTPTSYGQVSQIAQIYRGFGIDGMMFYRGFDPEACHNEYILEAPDGSRILGVRLSPNLGRGAFYLYVERRTMLPTDWTGYRWDHGHLPFHLCRAGIDHEEEPRLLRAPFLETWNPAPIADGVRTAMNEALREATCTVLCMFDGMDSTGPNPRLPDIIRACNEVNPSWRFRISSLPEFLEDLKAHADPRRLDVLRGEQRHPSRRNAFNAFLKDSLSARMYLKIRNAEAERALLQWAEPFTAFARPLGMDDVGSALPTAWKILLSNHAHDSIGGLSPDRIHSEMEGRFDAVIDLAEAVARKSLGAIVASIDTSDADPGDVLITVFNPCAQPRDDVVECHVDLPRAGAEPPRPFAIEDPAGARVLQQTTGREQSYLIATEQSFLPMIFDTWKWRVAFEARGIPALGYATYRVRPIDAPGKANYGSQRRAANTMENEFLRVTVESNGTLTALHKPSGETYRNLNFFEDAGECGDPWWRWPPPDDRVITSLGCAAEIAVEDDGPVLTTLSARLRLRVPAGVAETKMRRRAEERELTITSYATLRKGLPRIEVRTVVDNTADDHRLRMMAEAGFRPDVSHAHVPFDVVRRPVPLPDTSEQLEPATGTHPMNGFHGVADGRRGLAILSLGLTEYEVIDDDAGTVATTLLRTFQYPKMSGLMREDRVKRHGNEGSQMRGIHTFRYAFVLHGGTWREAGILRQMQEFRCPVMPTHHGRHAGAPLGKTHSFLEVTPPDLCLSAVKPAERGRGVIVRIYNPTDDPVAGAVRVSRPIRRAWRTELDEEPVERIAAGAGGAVEIEVPRKTILTLLLEFDEDGPGSAAKGRRIP